MLSGDVPRDATTGAPTTPPPYVLVYIGFRIPKAVEEPEKVSLEEGASNAIYTTAFCHSVGGNQHAALAVGSRVRAALLGVAPAISGRECGPIKPADSAPIQRDESTGVLVSDLFDAYEFLSLPG